LPPLLQFGNWRPLLTRESRTGPIVGLASEVVAFRRVLTTRLAITHLGLHAAREGQPAHQPARTSNGTLDELIECSKTDFISAQPPSSRNVESSCGTRRARSAADRRRRGPQHVARSTARLPQDRFLASQVRAQSDSDRDRISGDATVIEKHEAQRIEAGRHCLPRGPRERDVSAIVGALIGAYAAQKKGFSTVAAPTNTRSRAPDGVPSVRSHAREDRGTEPNDGAHLRASSLLRHLWYRNQRPQEMSCSATLT
jgi:hypothetical protein